MYKSGGSAEDDLEMQNNQKRNKNSPLIGQFSLIRWFTEWLCELCLAHCFVSVYFVTINLRDFPCPPPPFIFVPLSPSLAAALGPLAYSSRSASPPKPLGLIWPTETSGMRVQNEGRGGGAGGKNPILWLSQIWAWITWMIRFLDWIERTI